MLTRELQATGATVVPEEDGALAVTGVLAAEIGSVASTHNVVLEELSPQSASLEEAFMELTHDSVEYRGEGDADADANGEGDADAITGNSSRLTTAGA